MKIIKPGDEGWSFRCPVALGNGHFGCVEYWRNRARFVDINDDFRYPEIKGPHSFFESSSGLVFGRSAVRKDGRLGGVYFHKALTGEKINKPRILLPVQELPPCCGVNQRYSFFSGSYFFEGQEGEFSLGTAEAISAAIKEIETHYVLPRRRPNLRQLQRLLFIVSNDGAEVRVMDLECYIEGLLPSSDGNTLLVYDYGQCVIIDL